MLQFSISSFQFSMNYQLAGSDAGFPWPIANRKSMAHSQLLLANDTEGGQR